MRTPLASSPRPAAMLIWAGFLFAAVALAGCGGGQRPAGGAPEGLFARGLDQIGELYIEPVSTRRLALAGIARLSRLDDRPSIGASGDARLGEALALTYDPRSTALYSPPADGNSRDWGELIGNLVGTARSASPRLAAMPQVAVEKAVFDGMTGTLDHYSR